MRDCPNVEAREALPDLIHDRLPAAERERVLAHVRGCADCAAELALLRGVRSAVAASAPVVDASAIARAVRARLAPPAVTVVPITRARRPLLADWRLRAAAGVLLVAGAASGVLVARGGRDVPTSPRADTVLAMAEPALPAPVAPAAPESAAPRRVAPHAAATARTDLALGSSFSDLSDDELAAIIEAVSGKDAKLPPADPGAGADLVGLDGRE